MGGQIDEMVVRLDNSPRIRCRMQQFAGQSRECSPVTRMWKITRTQTASGGVIDANVNGNFPVLITFSLLFLVGGLVITGILLGRIVQSERQRIGTLRGLGVRRR